MSEGDMGPFAGMDAALERAITNYGTPPYRELVTVKVRDVGQHSFDELPTTVGDWIEWLEAARNEALEDYRAGLRCVLNWEASGDSASLDIWYERPETDDEMKVRVNHGIAYVQNREAEERATYERLRHKFG